MKAEAPAFWWRGAGWQSALLAPFAAAYGAAARWRLDRGERAEAGIPVLCVGNFTVGGGGKTPTALALGRAAIDLGLKPGFLSRGHGGAAREAMIVDPERHGAGLVGDEPMLLAALAPTAIAADRKRGAALLRAAGADFVIMDDGFQSARLRADLALLVVDAGRGIGNGRVLPAGPLRAPLVDQVRHADAVLLVGAGEAGASPSGRRRGRASRFTKRASRRARASGWPAGGSSPLPGLPIPTSSIARSTPSAPRSRQRLTIPTIIRCPTRRSPICGYRPSARASRW